jgi:hypothetical protein
MSHHSLGDEVPVANRVDSTNFFGTKATHTVGNTRYRHRLDKDGNSIFESRIGKRGKWATIKEEDYTKGLRVMDADGNPFDDVNVGAEKASLTKGGHAVKGAASLGLAAVAIGAAVAATVVTVKAATNAYKKYSDAAEVAKAEAKAMQEAYQQAAESTKNLQSTWEAYGEATKTMEGMVKGTLEYKQAVVEANAKAMELL